MANQRALPAGHGVLRSFVDDGEGNRYRREYQDGDAILKHVEFLRHSVNEAPKSGNNLGLRHEGTVPITMVIAWCNSRGYTFDQWARNEGHQPGQHWKTGSGVKDEFMRYFKSREFSKLHNEHVTTKQESSQIVVPTTYRTRERD